MDSKEQLGAESERDPRLNESTIIDGDDVRIVNDEAHLDRTAKVIIGSNILTSIVLGFLS